MKGQRPQGRGLAQFIMALNSSAVFVLVLLLPMARPAQGRDLVAFYRFDKDGNDSLGQNPSFVFSNQGAISSQAFFVTEPPITNGVLHLDGRYDPNGHQWNYLGTSPLTNFDYNSFAISIDFCPLPLIPRRILKFEQKLDLWTGGRYLEWFGPQLDPSVVSTSNILTGGPYYRWIGFNRHDNTLNLTLNNGAFEHHFAGVVVEPCHWHNLICSVDQKRQQVLVWFDARQLESVKLPDKFKFDVIGTANEERDREFTFADYSDGSVALGYAANLKIFRPALNDSEIGQLAALFPGECPAFTPRPPNSWGIILAGLGVLAIFVFLAFRARYRTAQSRKSRP